MKSFGLALALIFSPGFVFADDRSEAIKVFLNSSEVQASVAQARAHKLRVGKHPSLAFLSGSCGFVGCEKTYLVTLKVASQEPVNEQSSVIAAVVSVSTSLKPTVTMTSVEDLLK